MSVRYETARETAGAATEPDRPMGTYCVDGRRIVENDDSCTDPSITSRPNPSPTRSA